MYSVVRWFLLSYDVIHSIGFYSLGIKIDAIPSRINVSSSLRPLFIGEYRGFCFELCGQGHSLMLVSNIVMNYQYLKEYHYDMINKYRDRSKIETSLQ